MQLNKLKKGKDMSLQRGLVKEIIVIVAVIFVLAYFNLDPQAVWDKIVSMWNYFFG